MDYLLHLVILAGIYCILAVSLDLLVGHTGLLSLAHAAFWGTGAYISALLTVQAKLPFSVGLVAAMTGTYMIAYVTAIPLLRIRGDRFVIVTLGVQMIVFSILNNCTWLTQGPLGIPGIPHASVFGTELYSPSMFAVLTVSCAMAAYLAALRISNSPFARILHAVREDELFAMAMGKDTKRAKMNVFAASACLAAMGGTLYAHYMTYIDPTSFTVMESILILSMVIIGGLGSVWGPLIGAIVLVTVPEALRFVGFPSSLAAHMRQCLYGSLLVILMIVRPRGLVGKYVLDQ